MEYDADAVASEVYEVAFAELGHVAALEQNFSGSRMIESSEKIQQCGFAGTGASDEGYELPARDVEAELLYGGDVFTGELKGTGYVDGFDGRRAVASFTLLIQ